MQQSEVQYPDKGVDKAWKESVTMHLEANLQWIWFWHSRGGLHHVLHRVPQIWCGYGWEAYIHSLSYKLPREGIPMVWLCTHTVQIWHGDVIDFPPRIVSCISRFSSSGMETLCDLVVQWCNKQAYRLQVSSVYRVVLQEGLSCCLRHCHCQQVVFCACQLRDWRYCSCCKGQVGLGMYLLWWKHNCLVKSVKHDVIALAVLTQRHSTQ